MTEQHGIFIARAGYEFEVMDDMAKLGVWHWRGTRVEFERRGKNRTPDAYDYPKLRNYVWAAPEPHQLHLVMGIDNLARTVMWLNRRDLEEFRKFAAATDEKEAEARRIAGNRAAIRLYNEGEEILISSPLGDKLAKFARMVQMAGDAFPKVEADVEMLGRVVRMRVDPLSVRKTA